MVAAPLVAKEVEVDSAVALKAMEMGWEPVVETWEAAMVEVAEEVEAWVVMQVVVGVNAVVAEEVEVEAVECAVAEVMEMVVGVEIKGQMQPRGQRTFVVQVINQHLPRKDVQSLRLSFLQRVDRPPQQ